MFRRRLLAEIAPAKEQRESKHCVSDPSLERTSGTSRLAAHEVTSLLGGAAALEDEGHGGGAVMVMIVTLLPLLRVEYHAGDGGEEGEGDVGDVEEVEEEEGEEGVEVAEDRKGHVTGEQNAQLERAPPSGAVAASDRRQLAVHILQLRLDALQLLQEHLSMIVETTALAFKLDLLPSEHRQVLAGLVQLAVCGLHRVRSLRGRIDSC